MVRTIDGEQTDVAFLDFSSSISRTPIVTLVISYLGSRLQHVATFRLLLPQESHRVLSLDLLYLCYLLAICVLCHSSTLALFADEAKCFRAIRSPTDCA